MESLLVRETLRRDRVEFIDAEHRQNCIPAVHDIEVSNRRWKLAARLVTELGKTIFPWQEWDTTDVDRAMIKRMSDEWKEIWGDPNDPEVKARIDAITSRLRRRNA